MNATNVLTLPTSNGELQRYQLSGRSLPEFSAHKETSRIMFAACHVVADPLAGGDPSATSSIHWPSTMAYRHYLANSGLGIAEAMDTAQRGMGLDWAGALELVRRTRAELPDALVFNGCGTDQLDPNDAKTLDDVHRAYAEQLDAVQKTGARVILMASRALARIANCAEDYRLAYRKALSQCNEPVILHWLGDMFDPALAGYFGSSDLDQAMACCLEIIEDNCDRIDGIKISLLDKDREITMRRRLPEGVKMYTGDDFNYPELIAGDEQGYSHALLGIFDPLAPLAACANGRLANGDVAGFHEILDPTVPLARHIFQAPTQFYKTGVVFLAWLNGHQDHFVMLAGAQSMRSLPHLADLFRLADGCALLADPESASERFAVLLRLYGVDQ